MPISLEHDNRMELQQAKALADSLLTQHRLRGWKFVFDKAKTRFGFCSCKRRTISLSAPLTEMNSEAEVRDTILHEIAHALTWKTRKQNGHGPAWRKIARDIGCKAERCYGEGVSEPKGKYLGTCPGCAKEIQRHKRTRISCSSCSPTFDPQFLFVWKEREV